MKQLEEGMILYHGSYCIVENPDLQKCAKYKDFGQGFYLTASKEQNKNIEEVLISFMESNTSRMVYDDSTKLWWDGPAAVAQEYKNKIGITG